MTNGHHLTPSAAAAATASLGMIYIYVCLFYYTNDYLKVAITMNGGRRAWDASWSILSLKYVLKAVKHTNGNDMGSKEEKWEKGSSRHITMCLEPQVCHSFIVVLYYILILVTTTQIY